MRRITIKIGYSPGCCAAKSREPRLNLPNHSQVVSKRECGFHSRGFDVYVLPLFGLERLTKPPPRQLSFASSQLRVFRLGFFQEDVEVRKCIENGCVYGLAVACSHNVALKCSHCCFCCAINAINRGSFLTLSN
jgi:hypothetical protein